MNRIIQYLLLSIFTGVLLSLAWPEIGNMSLLVFVAFVPLLHLRHLLEKNKVRFKILFYYLSFFIWNILTTWWVKYASIEGAIMAFVLNAMFMSMVFNTIDWVWRTKGDKMGIIALVCLWTSWEYLHLNWELTWPWLTLGNVFANNIKWVQWYEYTGHLGGTFWILLSNGLSYRVLKHHLDQKNLQKTAWKSIPFLLLIVLPIGFSHVVFNGYTEKENPVEFVVVQPNIDPYNDKFGRMPSKEQLEKILQLADQKVLPTTDFLLAPETAISRTLDEDNLETEQEYIMLKTYQKTHPNLSILIGLSSMKIYGPTNNEASTSAQYSNFHNVWYDNYNTALFLNQEGKSSLYHKSKLVPGVENMPLSWLIAHFEDLAIDLGGTVGSLGVQKNREVFFNQQGCGIAPVICYESVFGEYVTHYIKNGAHFICIITNDGWWDDTPGYRQHLAYARLRAIETRRSIARSANTGITCYINQKGQVFDKTTWWEEDVVAFKINRNDTLSFYVQHGDWLARVCVFVGLGILLLVLVWRLRFKNTKA